MTLINVTEEDAKLFVNKIKEQQNRQMPDQVLMKFLRENGVNKFATPYDVSWEITSACNLRCQHCCFAGSNYDSACNVSHQTAINFAQELIEADVVRVMLTGGEPLLRDDLFDIINVFKTKNVAIELTTNAMLITEENAKKIAELFNPICDYVQVSLDGADAEIHEKTRGKDSFNCALNGIKLLIANGINVTINSVITNLNMHQMCELYDLGYDLGVNLITFSKIFVEKNNEHLLPDNNLLFKETIKLLHHEKANLPINLRLFSYPELATNSNIINFLGKEIIKIQDFNCHKNEKIHIRRDGEVFLCLYASNKNVCSLGNIKHNSLVDIIDNMQVNPLYQERIIKNSKCNNCKIQFYCKAGCPVNALLKKGTIHLPDSKCLI